jgi:hypothetical protein
MLMRWVTNAAGPREDGVTTLRAVKMQKPKITSLNHFKQQQHDRENKWDGAR